jgi:predicted transcriptional regulator YheO
MSGEGERPGANERRVGAPNRDESSSPARRARAHVGKGGPAARAALSTLAEMAPDLARALGPDHEVVLHDLRLIPNSIVAIGGGLTGRSVGGPTTDLLLRLVHHRRHANVLRYQTRSADGRTLRSSTLFIRDPDNRPVGCLCINTDITDWLGAQALVDSMTKVISLEVTPPQPAEHDGISPGADRPPDGHGANFESQPEEPESFAPTVDELAVSLVRRAVENAGVPVELMQKPHRLQVVRELEACGLFLIRDAVDLTADMLSISRYSVYSYLREVQTGASEGDELSTRQGRGKRRRLPLAREEGSEGEEEAT